MNWLNDWEKVDEYVVVTLILLLGIIGSPECGVYSYNKLHLTFAGNSPKETIGRKEDFDFRKYFSKLFNTFIVHNFDRNISKCSGRGRDLLFYIYK